MAPAVPVTWKSGRSTAEAPCAAEQRWGTVLVVLTFLLALAGGWLLKTGTEGRSVSFVSPDGRLALSYPAGWTRASVLARGVLLDVFDTQAGSLFPARLRVQARPAAASATLHDLAVLAALDRGNALREYRELSNTETVVGGQRALKVEYAYVADPPSGAGAATLPIVVRGTDTLVLAGDRLVVISSLRQTEDSSAGFDRILNSVVLK
jgi:hypothetical protein